MRRERLACRSSVRSALESVDGFSTGKQVGECREVKYAVAWTDIWASMLGEFTESASW